MRDNLVTTDLVRLISIKFIRIVSVQQPESPSRRKKGSVRYTTPSKLNISGKS